MPEELDLVKLYSDPLIEITMDEKQIWIEDKLIWEKDND